MIKRCALIPYFGLGALLDPTRGDLVAGLGDITAERALKLIQTRMDRNCEGRRLLRDKPYITQHTLNQNKLSQLPEGSLGFEYYHYMREHGFNADERTPVRFIQDPDLKYIMTRYRQVHDFWHVLCKLPPDVMGEITLKW